jgi:predicted alpha/beta superfamily hydrolase
VKRQLLTRAGATLAQSALALILVLISGHAALARDSTAQPNVIVLKQTFTMPGLGRERTIRLYLPPDYANTTKRYPVLYMHDAQNLFDDATSLAGEWGVDETLNEMARTGRLEIMVVGIDHGGPTRNTELIPWDNPEVGKAEGRAYIDFWVNVVKPHVDRHYRTLPGRETTAIMGSSVGGLISHYAVLAYPQIFSKAGILSPAYWISENAYSFAAAKSLPDDTKLYFSVGALEPGKTVENVQRMMSVVRGPALPADHLHLEVTANAGHNEANWRAVFPRAVGWLFDAPSAKLQTTPADRGK